MDIKLLDAVKNFKKLQHQIEAWNWLQNTLTPEQLDGFASRYRKTGEKPPVSKEGSNSWEGVLAAAKAAGAKFPECVAAQWALESGWGKHFSGTWNAFGLKGNGSNVNTQEFINGKWITIQADFIDFPDLPTCITYLVERWYEDFGRFKGVNRATTKEECAKLLVQEGYATDPGYATKLIEIMNQKDSAPVENKQDTKSVILPVPYEYQLDNASGQGYRECFSSTCAMIAKYYGKVKNDDEYNKIRSQYGDTTSKDAQVAALKTLGFAVKFVTNGNAKLLEDEIKAGRPVAVGWLHKGLINNPSGGGHWTCCIGFTEDSFVFNDPNGEADMVNGDYASNNASKGKGVKYSRKNWLRRWECDGSNTGWALIVSK